MRNILFTFIAFLCISFNTLNANTYSFDPPVLVEVLSKDFPLFRDSDDKIIYIDFELITTNVKSIRIISENGMVTFQDDLKERKVNDIYEFDYSDYLKGAYKLELLAYSGKVLSAHLEIKS